MTILRLPSAKMKEAPAGSAGASLVTRIVTNVRSIAGAGRLGYQDGRRPVALLQQVPGGHERPGLAVPGAEHTRIPVPVPSAGPPCAEVYVPAAAATAPSPDRQHGPRSAARSLRRGGRGRHWPGAAAATAGSSAGALPRPRRGPAGFRPAPASEGPRISASAEYGPADVRPPAG